MGTQTQTTIYEVDVERVGVISIIRVVDFAAILASAKDGKVDVDVIENSGDIFINFQPKTRGADSTRTPSPDEDSARAYVGGFIDACELRKRAPNANANGTGANGSNGESKDLARLTKAKLIALCEEKGIEVGHDVTKKADYVTILTNHAQAQGSA